MKKHHSNSSEKVNLENVHTEINDIILQHPAVKRCRARIEHWCQNVFGDSNILRAGVEDVLADPSTGGKLVERLSENCQSFGKLSGVNMCGIKNRARRHAEASISPLIDTVEELMAVVQQVRGSVSQNDQLQKEQQKSSRELAGSLHTQQDLSKSSESLSASMDREVPGTSRHQNEKTQSVESCKATKTKALVSIS
ncbi:BID domain-containing T4SS effector [Bartonella sp. B23]